MAPPLLLADEPTGNLDENQAQQVWHLFLELVREVGSTVVVATHNLRLAQSADEVYRLQGGRLVQES